MPPKCLVCRIPPWREKAEAKAETTLRRGKAGERIIEQGKSLDKMFIMMEGKAEVLINQKQIFTFSGQNLFGEIEFLDMLPASADVTLFQDTDLIELDQSALTSLMENQPRLGYVLMKEIAKIESQCLRALDQK
ncbi:cyclic nucleotide-binding domain-containing protein [candidate division KSB1 bacterium]|nr:cyclic nucleotide-binding domain-containing protein [candidate division KSB1 bacterium]